MIPAPPSITKEEEEKDDGYRSICYYSDDSNDGFSVRNLAEKRKRRDAYTLARDEICGTDKKLRKLYDGMVRTPTGSPINSPIHSDSEEDNSICDSDSQSES